MGNRADDEGTDVEIYRKPLTDTVHADTPTGAPEQLLALLDRLGFERKTVSPAGTAGPTYAWHEAPSHLSEDEKKRLATRAVPHCSQPDTSSTSPTTSSTKPPTSAPRTNSAPSERHRPPPRPRQPPGPAVRVAESPPPSARPTGVHSPVPQRPPQAVPYVLAAPGYLAGGGDWEHLTELLLHGHGWRNVSTIDQHTALASPDGRLHVILNRRADWTWTLHATTPDGQDWAMLLSAHIPVEYITAMVNALLQPPPTGDRAVLDPLRAAGWPEQATSPGASAVSPDGLVHFTEEPAHPSAPRPWRAACTVNGYRWWTATFSTRTPPGIVTAFTRNLASDDPLPRMAIGTPLYGCGPYTRLTPTPHTYEDEQALLKARIADVRSRRVTGPGTATPPPNPIGRTPATRTR